MSGRGEEETVGGDGQDDLVADLAGEAELVGENHHGHPGPGQGLHDVEDFADEFRIKCGCGFIEEHELGFHAMPAGAEPEHVRQDLAALAASNHA